MMSAPQAPPFLPPGDVAPAFSARLRVQGEPFTRADSAELAGGPPVCVLPLFTLNGVYLLDQFKIFLSFPFLSFVFLGPHLRHMEIPRLGVQSEL